MGCAMKRLLVAILVFVACGGGQSGDLVEDVKEHVTDVTFLDISDLYDTNDLYEVHPDIQADQVEDVLEPEEFKEESIDFVESSDTLELEFEEHSTDVFITNESFDIEHIEEVCIGPDCLPPCPDDGLDCTDQFRDQDGNCVTVIIEDFCLVENRCYRMFESAPSNECLICDPSVSQDQLLPATGLPCDDGNACTIGDECSPNGSCVSGVLNTCNDGNECTDDSCDAKTGCKNTPVSKKCDDHNLCTINDHCVNGVCVGTTIGCKPDNNPCTDDLCLPDKGCIYRDNDLPCDDFDACTENDTCTNGQCIGTPIDCSDNDPCTKEFCVHGIGPDSGCVYTWYYGPCDDNNVCTKDDICGSDHICKGTLVSCDDNNVCTEDLCDAQVGCLHIPKSGPCDDFDPCTEDDRCVDGECHGTLKDCRDENPCTIDWCDKVQGCLHGTTTGACDDGNACTVGETCATGMCAGGVPRDCNDNNPCTTDDCDPKKGCVYTPIDGECDDGDICTLYDHCVAGKCQGTPKDCDDKDPCTTDVCTIFGTCQHLPYTGPCIPNDKCQTDGYCVSGICVGKPVSCDDNNPCTLDGCDSLTGCYHNPRYGTCDDNNVCTTDDHCVNGVCTGTPIICNDGDPCTADMCDPLGGCWYDPSITGPCNDNDPCTIKDTCIEGECIGTSLFADPVNKGAKVAFGLSGTPGQGLDVDGNPSTCAPAGSCSNGIDNAMSAVAKTLFNPELTKATNNGTLALLFEHETPGPAPSVTYTLNMFWGQGLPGLCDFVAGSCNYRVFQNMIASPCVPKWAYPNAVIMGTHLSAGGPSYQAPFYVVFGTLKIPLIMKRARIEADVSFTDGVITSGAGVIGGAINRQAMIDTFKAVPAEQYPPPYTKDKVLNWLETLMVADLDLDGDGIKESVSLGITFTLTTGHIVGVQ